MRWSVQEALSGGLFLLGLVGPAVHAAGPDDWRSRSIYQVLTDRFALPDGGTEKQCNTDDKVYCGGNYHGIINRLDYIQGMGFSAVWISPVTLNLLGEPGGASYHGYWQKDIYQLNPRFGLADDLRALSDELHARGMYLMVDIVVNHYGWDGDAGTVDYSQLVPFNDQSYFHPACDINYNDQNSIEDCWLATGGISLPDVKTEDPSVVKMYSDWIRDLVSNFTIDGLRIDTAKHVDTAFWPEFSRASGVFSTGEVFNGDPAYTCPYQEHIGSVLNYPVYYSLTEAFSSTSGSMSGLAAMIQTVKSTCKDSTLLGSFSENHDLPRFASMTDDLSLAKNAIAYTMLADGIPIIYSGQEQHYAGGNDPSNREAVWLSGYKTDAPLYTLAASLNQIRNHAIRADGAYLAYKSWPMYTDTTTIAMRKGVGDKQIVTVLSNKGAKGDAYTLTLENHGFAAGSQVVEVLSCAEATVDSGGKLQVAMESGLPRVFYPAAPLSGSGICNY